MATLTFALVERPTHIMFNLFFLLIKHIMIYGSDACEIKASMFSHNKYDGLKEVMLKVRKYRYRMQSQVIINSLNVYIVTQPMISQTQPMKYW